MAYPFGVDGNMYFPNASPRTTIVSATGSGVHASVASSFDGSVPVNFRWERTTHPGLPSVDLVDGVGGVGGSGTTDLLDPGGTGGPFFYRCRGISPNYPDGWILSPWVDAPGPGYAVPSPRVEIVMPPTLTVGCPTPFFILFHGWDDREGLRPLAADGQPAHAAVFRLTGTGYTVDRMTYDDPDRVFAVGVDAIRDTYLIQHQVNPRGYWKWSRITATATGPIDVGLEMLDVVRGGFRTFTHFDTTGVPTLVGASATAKIDPQFVPNPILYDSHIPSQGYRVFTPAAMSVGQTARISAWHRVPGYQRIASPCQVTLDSPGLSFSGPLIDIYGASPRPITVTATSKGLQTITATTTGGNPGMTHVVPPILVTD